MNLSFPWRFLLFTCAFWSGAVLSIVLITATSRAGSYHVHYWPWFLSGLRENLFPIVLSELFRSPFMGLLFALLGRRYTQKRSIIRFGIVCGLASYILADAFKLMGESSWRWALYFRGISVESVVLGTPILLILLSRFVPEKKTG